MEFFLKIISLQLMLFALIAVGVILNKSGILKTQNRKVLSDVLIYAILPCNILNAFVSGVDFSASLAGNFILALAISAVIQVFVIITSPLVFKKLPKERRNINAYGMICSNSSFVGIPVAEALFGDIGVLYTSMFQIPSRFCMWTAGLALFTTVDGKAAIKKLLQHPCIIAVFLGLPLMWLRVQLPAFVETTISSIGRCTTAISMFVIGSILAEADMKSIFSKDVLYFTSLRLVILPLFVWSVLKIFRVDSLVISIAVLLSGMPAGSTTSILADKYNGDAEYASRLVFTSTLASILTIPVLGLVLQG